MTSRDVPGMVTCQELVTEKNAESHSPAEEGWSEQGVWCEPQVGITQRHPHVLAAHRAVRH